MNPAHLYDSPVGALYTHLDAYPEFRSPLSPDDEERASAEFHLAAIRRLSRGNPVVVLTFDWENPGQDGGWESDLAEIEADDRELWLSYVEEPEVEDCVIMHAFLTTMAPDDRRLAALTRRTADGNLSVTVTDPNLNWIARPNEQCVALYTFDPENLSLLQVVEDEIRAKWQIQTEREPLLDLAAVTAAFDERRSSWERAGITVRTGPQYRSLDGERIAILDRMPADPRTVDWFLIGLACGNSEASVIVYDTGTCDVAIDLDTDDPDGDVFRERRQGPGSHDLRAVAAVFDRVAAALQHGKTHAPG
jgi:hypothetical protein